MFSLCSAKEESTWSTVTAVPAPSGLTSLCCSKLTWGWMLQQVGTELGRGQAWILQEVGVGLDAAADGDAAGRGRAGWCRRWDGLDAAASKGGLGVLQLHICLGCNRGTTYVSVRSYCSNYRIISLSLSQYRTEDLQEVLSSFMLHPRKL